MNRHFIALLVLLLLVVTGWQAPKTHYVLTDESTLWVTGTSTVHDWKCDVKDVDGWIDAEVGETITSLSKAEVTVQANGLECKNGTMNKKAFNALDADKNPIISYTLKTAEITSGKGMDFSAKTTGALTIAGKTQSVTATVRGQMMPDGDVRLSTTLPVTMSTYGIDPPTAMLGALKTGDDVMVHFEAVATPVKGT